VSVDALDSSHRLLFTRRLSAPPVKDIVNPELLDIIHSLIAAADVIDAPANPLFPLMMVLLKVVSASSVKLPTIKLSDIEFTPPDAHLISNAERNVLLLIVDIDMLAKPDVIKNMLLYDTSVVDTLVPDKNSVVPLILLNAILLYDIATDVLMYKFAIVLFAIREFAMFDIILTLN
jgi:hypothetical protein